MRPTLVFVPSPSESVRDAPSTQSFAIQADIVQDIEPAPYGSRTIAEGGVAQQTHAVQLTLADERLRIDHKPWLPLGAQHVASMDILVHEVAGSDVSAQEDVACELDQRSLERHAALLILSRDLVRPPCCLVGEMPEGMRAPRFVEESWEKPGQDACLVDLGIPETRTWTAALTEESAPLVVAS